MRDSGPVQRASDSRAERPRAVLALGAAVPVLVIIVVVFALIRVTTDWPHILASTVPDDDFAERYVAHPWLAYLHIAPGVVFLLGAPVQFLRRFRARHYTLHRWLGRVLLVAGLLSGVLALVFGVLFPWGGVIEAGAAVVFGAWFVIALALAFRAIRRRNVPQHRRWMVRAFAVGLGVGTIRLWVGLFTASVIGRNNGPDGLTLPDQATFAAAFWLGLTMHVAAGEWWLRHTPDLRG